MRHAIFLLLLLPVFCFSQKKDSLFKVQTDSLLVLDEFKQFSLTIMDNRDSINVYSISFGSDSTIEIYGDTTKVLWMMQKYLIEYQDRLWAAKAVLDRLNLQRLKELLKSKEINTAVNDYLKTEKKYKNQ